MLGWDLMSELKLRPPKKTARALARDARLRRRALQGRNCWAQSPGDINTLSGTIEHEGRGLLARVRKSGWALRAERSG